MFVTDKSLGEIQKLYFINDKELPAMGSKSERLVLQFLELLSNSTAVTPHTNIFSMDKKNKFVTKDTVCVQVTPAQQKLLQFITPIEAEDIYNSLKKVHYLGTYCVDTEMAELSSSRYVHELLDAIQQIVNETFINNLKTS